MGGGTPLAAESGRPMELATLESKRSPLAQARLQRQLPLREAAAKAGLTVPPKPFEANPRTRLLVLAAIAAAATALVAALVMPGRSAERARAAAAAQLAVEAQLPKPWHVAVDVRNGSGDINYTRRVASRIGALGYHVARVGKADRFDYPQTAVYYERGGREVAERLARQLSVISRPLPGGKNPRRLVVIVGPNRG